MGTASLRHPIDDRLPSNRLISAVLSWKQRRRAVASKTSPLPRIGCFLLISNGTCPLLSPAARAPFSLSLRMFSREKPTTSSTTTGSGRGREHARIARHRLVRAHRAFSFRQIYDGQTLPDNIKIPGITRARVLPLPPFARRRRRLNLSLSLLPSIDSSSYRCTARGPFL